MARSIRKIACQIFLRHPADIQITVNVISSSAARTPFLMQAKNNGLVFSNSFALSNGMLVKITIPVVRPCFELFGYISWCRRRDYGYQVGMALMSETDMARTRMVEQVCYIEHYRRSELKGSRRSMSVDDAAREWIQKYASKFPRLTTSTISRRAAV